MNIKQKKFMATQVADMDWMKVMGNENPYSPITKPDEFEAYNNHFNYLSEERADWDRSVA